MKYRARPVKYGQPLGVMARIQDANGRPRSAFFPFFFSSSSDPGEGAEEQARDWLEAQRPKGPSHPLFAMMAASYRKLTRRR